MSLRSGPAGPVPVGPVGPVPVGPFGPVPVGPVRFQSVWFRPVSGQVSSHKKKSKINLNDQLRGDSKDTAVQGTQP